MIAFPWQSLTNVMKNLLQKKGIHLWTPFNCFNQHFKKTLTSINYVNAFNKRHGRFEDF